MALFYATPLAAPRALHGFAAGMPQRHRNTCSGQQKTGQGVSPAGGPEVRSASLGPRRAIVPLLGALLHGVDSLLAHSLDGRRRQGRGELAAHARQRTFSTVTTSSLPSSKPVLI